VDSYVGPSASIETLKQRAALLRRTRAFFDDRDFFEVQPPCLMREAISERHIDPILVPVQGETWALQSVPVQGETWALQSVPVQGETWALQSSPEQAMKRLIVAGAESIYAIVPAFRDGERGAMHNPEFTMLEWYRVGDGLAEGVAFLAALASELLGRRHAEVITYREVFEQFAGFDPLAIAQDELPDIVRRSLAQHGHALDPRFDGPRDDWLDALFSLAIQPRLGFDRPTIVTHYLASQAALARIAADGKTAERFELFVDGIELANGYAELTDSKMLLARQTQTREARMAALRPAAPLPQRLIGAQRLGLPSCSGCALGFDRLAMVALRKGSIGEVLAFDVESS
jgi:elongation factor P--(R)-beta-lysine ligase